MANVVNKSGRKASRGLFAEYADEYVGVCEQIYSMANFHKRFVEMMDLTEYKPAMELVGSWQEWNRLKRDFPEFRDNITLWKDEIEVKMRSQAIERLNTLMTSKNEQTAAGVCKFISTLGFNEKKGAGRPSKEEMRRQASELARITRETEDDAARVLEVINGGNK
jgi:hypothetical protein